MSEPAARRSQVNCTVTRNDPLCREHYRLILRAGPDFAPTEPGQFVQILCADPSQNASAGAFLRRPFSLAGRRDLRDGACEIDIIHRVVGIGTAWLAELREGDCVNILGPLGNRFGMPVDDETAVLVGGGVGIPPMLYLAEKLAREGHRAVAFVGATSRELLPLRVQGAVPGLPVQPSHCVEEFARHGIKSVISTDDGSLGFKGFVTQALEQWPADPAVKVRLYTCGPELMMKRVVEIATARNTPCEVAVERAMACGMGTCQSCCIRVRVPHVLDPDGWRYKLTCTDGPIFAGSDLLW